MYRHIKSYELRYTDVDAFDNLKLSSLLSFLEESACLSADELGFGYDDIAPSNLGFVVVNWYIELNRAVKLGEILTVHTWPIKPKMLCSGTDISSPPSTSLLPKFLFRFCIVSTSMSILLTKQEV